jgi:hypothetical protein
LKHPGGIAGWHPPAALFFPISSSLFLNPALPKTDLNITISLPFN